jgi:N-acyl-L-homoserine lactone synthetase
LFLTRCLEVFGPAILPSLSFVSGHIDWDVGHTYFNERELAKLVDSTPESLPALVAAGTAALDAYAEFLSDCVALAEHHYSTIRKSFNRWSQFLSWRLQPPPEILAPEGSESIPRWLEESRALRGAVLFNDGRRPRFRRSGGGYDDPDPIDFYAWHVLAYHRSTLVGCVRVYPITEDGPPSLTESILGTDEFTRMLDNLGKQREHVIEIGRWVVDPAFRNGRSLAPGIGLELAAGAGALALALADQIESGNGIAIFAAGTRNGQYLTLTRLGLKMVAGLSSVRSSEYDDFIQVLHCDSATKLQPRLRRIIESLSIAMRIEETVQMVHNRALYSSSAASARL